MTRTAGSGVGRSGGSADRRRARALRLVGPSDGSGALGRVRGGVKAVLWWVDSVLGGQDYRRYVEHLRRNHPGREIPTERDYWRDRYAEADRNPQNRCC
ncbi:YbdD/YjiX family protein [Nocardia noduli]|uniref:YbdD/YjiX family protein n=1 Tax=Nocardia noduli TaxID=2815722 RepID=UPI001C24DBB5